MANQVYPPELKAQVIADWKAGGSLHGLQKAHHVPIRTIRDWTEGHERTVAAPKKEECAPNLDEMAWGLVGGAFLALGNIQGITNDPAWLQRQHADTLAVLYGVIADKLIRLLGAARQRDDDANTGAPEIASSTGAGG